MDKLSMFWVAWSLACVCWVWMIVSDVRTGCIGWTFLKVERLRRPARFWAFFTLQNGLVLLALIYLAGLMKGIR
jgi:hypothetical protein